MTLQPETRDTDRSGLNRRTVLKAGAHAAWAIPAVQVITQAPALATSGQVTSSDPVPTGSGAWTGASSNRTIACTLSVNNQGTAATAGLVLTASFPSGWDPAVTTPSNGWTVSKSVNVFTFKPPSPLAAGSTSTFSVTFTPKSNNKNRAVRITLATTVGNGTGEGGQIDVAAG